MRYINVLIIGGSGLWAEKNHYSAILALKSEGLNIRIVAICDPIAPNHIEKQEKRNNLKRILKLDNPIWISPFGKADYELYSELNNLNKQFPLDAVIISANPVYHYFYCKWALKNHINLLCDKPLITAKDSSFNVSQAILIQKQYEELKVLYQNNKSENSSYIFCSPLRRRALTPFVKIAKELNKTYLKTGEGIRYMNVIINGGIHKYPAEYIKGGAHGHLDGVGTLSHSSYHYIDVIAWYLKMAKGDIKEIEVSMPYLMRVGEYLKTGGYKKLRDLIEGNSKKFYDDIEIPEAVLNSELDFSFYLKLKDKNKNLIGLITFIVNYSTYAPRLTKYDENVTEYAHDLKGGRMSSVYFDIHQGAIQQWQLIKNDEVALGHDIELRQRLHPRLGKKLKVMRFADAYEHGTFTSKDLFKDFIKASAGRRVAKRRLSMLSLIDDQSLTNRLYSIMYEKIAEEFENNNSSKNSYVSSSIINLNEYL